MKVSVVKTLLFEKFKKKKLIDDNFTIKNIRLEAYDETMEDDKLMGEYIDKNDPNMEIDLNF